MESVPNTTPSPVDDIKQNKVLAAISYIYIVSLIMLLVKKDSPFVQFHAKQGFVLFIASLICGFIPVIGWIVNIAILVLVIMGIIAALKGESKKLPLVSSLAEKINF